MTDALVVSGSGPYADPWHRFAETSARIAAIVEDLGYSVLVSEDVEAALADPGRCRLLIVNIGNPARPRPAEAIESARIGLENHLSAGGSLLGIHVSATSLTAMSRWSAMLGGHWVRGRSLHPPQSEATISIAQTEHPVIEGLADFTVDDERYSYLHTEEDTTVLCEHAFEGRRHPVVWARATPTARVIYDGLGHDAGSYDSPGHLELFQRITLWLLRDLDEWA